MMTFKSIYEEGEKVGVELLSPCWQDTIKVSKHLLMFAHDEDSMEIDIDNNILKFHLLNGEATYNIKKFNHDDLTYTCKLVEGILYK